MPRSHWKQAIPLSDLTTIGIGGPAQHYVAIHTVDECRLAIRECVAHNIPFFVLGKGSNCLFSDEGFRGALLHIKIDSYESPEPGVFTVGAGFSFSLLGTRTARDGWSGLEFATGIPASVGGAVFMNAGANGQETCDHLEEVQFLHPDGTIESFRKDSLAFGYRTSPFQKMPGAILAATFRLRQSADAKARQQDLFQYRKKTQPYHEKSAGCIFRNPSGSSAGALIERQGLKGHSVGGATVSEMHANFLVNRSGATAKEMLSLMEQVEVEVEKKTGIALCREIRIISPLGELYE
jgi:UDP-N-acetylmuramate dehydrogenase